MRSAGSVVLLLGLLAPCALLGRLVARGPGGAFRVVVNASNPSSAPIGASSARPSSRRRLGGPTAPAFDRSI